MNGNDLRQKMYHFLQMTEDEKKNWNDKSISTLIDLVIHSAEQLKRQYEKERLKGN